MSVNNPSLAQEELHQWSFKEAGIRVGSIFLLLVLHLIFDLSDSLNAVGFSKLSDYNYAYLIQAEKESFEMFVTLTGLKSAFAMMESSSAGFAFVVDVSVQVGKMIEGLGNIVDLGWQATLTSLSVLFGLQLIYTFFQESAFFIITACLCSALVHQLMALVLPKFKVFSRSILKACFFLTLITQLLFPLSLLSSAWIANALAHPTKSGIAIELSQAHEEISVSKEHDSMREQAQFGLDSYLSFSKTVDEKLVQITGMVTKHLAILTLELLLIPSLLFWGLLKICMWSWEHTLVGPEKALTP